tara:strand:- start:1444 stop:1650 length:207 start_codon:yes stop_codon:yes gene_type:complete
MTEQKKHWLKKQNLENVVIPGLKDKVATLIKMKKDFPTSDDVRFELQDSLTQLDKVKKDLWVLEHPPR